VYKELEISADKYFAHRSAQVYNAEVCRCALTMIGGLQNQGDGK
jgi:hypothetical protein